MVSQTRMMVGFTAIVVTAAHSIVHRDPTPRLLLVPAGTGTTDLLKSISVLLPQNSSNPSPFKVSRYSGKEPGMPEESQVATPLQVERSTVTKLVITGAPSLDPITVFLEDLAPCKGKITVSCWGKSWTAYWGGMWDGLSIGQFFCELNTGYIIGYFDQAMSSRQFSAEALADKVRREILQMRRSRDLDESDARDLYDEAEDIRYVNSMDSLGGAHYQLMQQVLGDEWWHLSADATEPNPDWDYLERIIHAVQQALRLEQQRVTP